MDSYGWDSNGISIIEIVNQRPSWTSNDVARIVFDNVTGCCWIGGISIDSGDNGWFRVGFDNNIVISSNIDWDYELTGDPKKVSADSIPCRYMNTITFVQPTIDYISDYLLFLSRGKYLNNLSIKNFHIDTTGSYKVDSSYIPIDNNNGYFYIGSKTTIEEALNFLANRNATHIYIDPVIDFGNTLGITASTVQEALDKFEQHLSNISADEIKCNCRPTSVISNVQFTFNSYYQMLKEKRFIDIIGVPDSFGEAGLFLRTDGISRIYYDSISAEDIFCFYPNTIETNVQAALYHIENNIIFLNKQISEFKQDSQDITYTSNSKFDDVNEVIDWLIYSVYNASKYPTASNVKMCKICDDADIDTVQESMMYLQNQFRLLISSIPGNISANNILYTSIYGHSTVQESLDYLFDILFVKSIGPPGFPGEMGPPGLMGIPGINGPPGSPGKIGKTGETGGIGAVGPPGQPGNTGGVGKIGEPGCPGNIGPPGYPGGSGGPGKSASPGDPGGPGNTGGTGEIGGPGNTGGIGGTGSPGTPGINGVCNIIHGTPGAPGGPGGPGAKGPPRGNCE